jgi:hypothetical protein
MERAGGGGGVFPNTAKDSLERKKPAVLLGRFALFHCFFSSSLDEEVNRWATAVKYQAMGDSRHLRAFEFVLLPLYPVLLRMSIHRLRKYILVLYPRRISHYL